MDLDARFVYPQRTAGEKVVMISAPMPEDRARAQVAAMDRHIRALEARLGRKTRGTVHWVRGPLLGMERQAIVGLCMGSRPGEGAADAEGLDATDRHEVAHCVLTSHCSARFDPPAVLTEGWAQANQGIDPVEQAVQLQEVLETGGGLSLRQLTGPDWYDRHDWPVYLHGAPLVNFLLDRFGPDGSSSSMPRAARRPSNRIAGGSSAWTSTASTPSSGRTSIGCSTRAGSAERRRLERLRLAPGVNAADWKAFLADYFAAAGRMLAPYRHARLTAVWTRTSTDAQGRTQDGGYEARLLRSGEFASLRRRWSGGELAYLAHPRHSIVARRESLDGPWQVNDESRRTPEQSRRRALDRIDSIEIAGHWDVAPLVGLAGLPLPARLQRSVRRGGPRALLRGRPAPGARPHRGPLAGRLARALARVTYVLAADDLYVPPV